MTTTTGKRRPVKAKVLDYLYRNQNIDLFPHSIAKDVGEAETSVSGVLSRLADGDDINVTRVTRGVYRYSPLQTKVPQQREPTKLDVNSAYPQKPVKRVYQEVGMARDGKTVILECEDGSLWKATEL